MDYEMRAVKKGISVNYIEYQPSLFSVRMLELVSEAGGFEIMWKK
jgi:hypothetical protein